MPSTDYGAELSSRPTNEEVQFLVDAPGFAVIREGDELSFTWSPGVCPYQVFEGTLQAWGLEVLEVHEYESGLRAGVLVGRLEGYATSSQGSAYSRG